MPRWDLHGSLRAYQEAIDVWLRNQLLAVVRRDAATVLDSDLPSRCGDISRDVRIKSNREES